MPGKKKNIAPQKVYKTEEQMKTEARENIERERLVEQGRKPKTSFERAFENYWYHYRALTFGILIAVAIAAFFIWDMILTVKPDVTAIMITSKFYSQELQDTLKSEMQQYATDINGDGRVVVQIDHIPFVPLIDDEGNLIEEDMDNQNVSQDEYAYLMKLMATVAAGIEQVYILDAPNYWYINNMDESEIFLNLDAIPGAEGNALPLMNTKLASSPDSKYYADISIYLRNLKVTDKNAAQLEGNELFIRQLVE